MNWFIDQEVELTKGAIAGEKRTNITPLAYPGSANAHQWRVHVKNHGIPLDLTGNTVTAYFQRSDGNVVVVQGATIDNMAYVIIPAEVYAISGIVKAYMDVVLAGSAITPVAGITFNVPQNMSGDIIDPGEVIPASLEELLAEIDAMRQATAEARAVVSSSVRYDAVQTLTDAQKEQARANIGALDEGGLAELESAISDIDDILTDVAELEKSNLTGTKTTAQTINGSAVVAEAATAYYVMMFDVTEGDKLLVSGSASNNGYLYIFTDTNDATIAHYPTKNTSGGLKNYSDIEAIAPQGAVKLVVASHSSASYTQARTDKVTGYSPKGVGTIADELNTLTGIIGTCVVGLIPSTVFPVYPAIDTQAKTFTLANDSILIDRRLTNGYKIIDTAVTVSYASFRSTAIGFYWDIANATVVVRAFNTAIDHSRYLLICLLRSNRGYVCSVIPVTVDGKLFGSLDTSLIDTITIYNNQNVKAINHRGYSVNAPENTLPAFKLSKNNGYLYVETDVRFNADGTPILMHDTTINRTCCMASDGSSIATTINVSDLHDSEMALYDACTSDQWSTYKGVKIPMFSQFISACKRLGLHAYIEIKEGTEAQIKGLHDTVRLYGMDDHVTWISYDIAKLGYIKDKNAQARLGYLASTITSVKIADAGSIKTATNEVFIDADNYSAVTAEAVAMLVAEDIPLEVFVNGPYGINHLNGYITGVTTDSDRVGMLLYNTYDL